jgi:hypothetical protein
MEHDRIRTARVGATARRSPSAPVELGGFGTLTKTRPTSPEEALVRFGSLKIAGRQSGAARRPRHRHDGMTEGIRMTLLDGKRYRQQYEARQQGRGRNRST